MNANAMTRRMRRILPALILSVGLRGSAAAQTPMVFVHGLNSNGTTWGSTPSAIAGQFYVNPMQPSLPSWDFFASQASSLRQQIGGQPQSLIAVGHSNGGIVSRVANRGGQPMQGIITVGTPHRGAQLATRVMDGATYFYLLNWGNAVVQAPIVYLGYEIGDLCGLICDHIYRGVVNVVNRGVDALYALGYLIPNVAGPLARTTKVLGQMEPNSPFINTDLNAGFNLTREAGALPIRSAIVSEAWPGYTSMFVGLTAGYEAHNTNWQHFVMAVYDANYWYYVDYADYSDPDMWPKRLNAWLWAMGFNALADMDYQWCNTQLGGWDFNLGFCRSDGIVPSSSQVWPDANRIHFAFGGPGHMRETDDPRIQNELANSLRGDGFSFAQPPPPPPQLPPPQEPPPLEPPPGGGGCLQGCEVMRAKPATNGGICQAPTKLAQQPAMGRTAQRDRRSVNTDARGKPSEINGSVGANVQACNY